MDGAAQRLFRASDLKRQRGWTDGLLAALLGAPDALSPNPHGYRSPMRWYRADRVLDAERLPAFGARAQRLGAHAAWRRELPTRSWSPEEVDQLEWLDHPARIALFHAPRRPRLRRRRPAPAPPTGAREPAYALPRFEVLTLF
ncbi:MAG TPA: hypothetical protein VFT50_19000 [Baekduia sp.]|nr:hypothetical protein [Baekduia sp.]